MKRAQRRKSGKSGLELIEEATHLLRTAPVATLAVYYLGAVPFVLGFLYFWADMSRNPFAMQHQAEAALGLAALFLWLKFCQVLFARRIRAQLAAAALPRWSFRQCARVFLTQAIVQPTGLFLLPLALIPVLPFAWTYAFYQNVTVLDDGDSGGAAPLVKKSWKQASLWPWQNLALLGIVGAFGFYIFLNWLVVCFSVPGLLKMLFGVESIFTKSAGSLLNTTFFTALSGLTYLCVDPILKVSYALRCFYGESLQSGEDLKAELKQFSLSPPALAAVLMLLFTLAGAPAAAATDAIPSPVPAAGPPASPGVSPPELDRAINEVIHERKYTWRMPREKIAGPESEDGVIVRFLKKIGSLLRRWVKAAWEWLEELLDKFFRRRRTVPDSGGGSGYGWIMSLQVLLYVLVAAVLCVLAIFLIRVWRNRLRPAGMVQSEPMQLAPDLTDENVGADQLPEDGWTKLARELLERGEFRLAMRAFYLANLAHLAQRNLISLARFKSNRDYESELRRRGHSFPGLLSAFGENLSVFERIWYGLHEVNRERVDQFAANVEKIRTGA